MAETSLVDWPLACAMLRGRSGRALEYWARQCGMDGRTLRQLARGEIQQPRFDQGVRLLDCCARQFDESDWERLRLSSPLARVRMEGQS